MADLRLTELLRTLDAAAARELRHMDAGRLEVLRQYKRVSMRQAAAELRAALDAPNAASREARLKLTLRAFDIAVKELNLPPARVESIIRMAVKERVQSVDELLKIQDPQLAFNDSAALQASAVGKARQDMNRYWEHEQKRFRDQVARVTRLAIRQNLPIDKAAQLLQERLNVSRSRAVLIVTDQTRTAAATAERTRQLALGIRTYLWRTQEDNRVRPLHRAKDGQRYAWADGGERPGDAILCRCRALPIVRV